MSKEQSSRLNLLRNFVEDHTSPRNTPKRIFQQAEENLQHLGEHFTPESKFNQLVTSGLHAFVCKDPEIADYARPRLWQAVTLYNDELRQEQDPDLQFRAANAMFTLSKIEDAAYMSSNVMRLLVGAENELRAIPVSERFAELPDDLQKTFVEAASERLDLVRETRSRHVRIQELTDKSIGYIDAAFGYSADEAA